MKLPKLLITSVFLVAALNVPALAEPPEDATLNDATYETWRDHVLPRSWELNFQKIEWRTSFWEAVVEAQEKDMPILLWTMNGHPLCNT
jgi:hypothetical protein